MKVLIFQHTEAEPPGAFQNHVTAAGDHAHIVRFFKEDPVPELADFQAMIVLGGPMDVWDTDAHPWLLREKAAIRQWVENLNRPYLGICLGHQLLADALGGECARLERPAIAVREIVKTDEVDPIFANLPQRFPVLQWHGVEVVRLPEDCVTLASLLSCRHQAIRHGKHAWGMQFHPEITGNIVSGWLDDPANMESASRWLGSSDAAQRFAASCLAHCDDALQLSTALYAGLRRAALHAEQDTCTT